MSDKNVCIYVPSHSDMTGWLYKWTNYMRGYQKRWFVLKDGMLSYYRNQQEAQHTCRGSVSIRNAIINIQDQTSFIVSNGGNMTLYLRAFNDNDRRDWIKALIDAKASRQDDQEDDDDAADASPEKTEAEIDDMMKMFNRVVTELKTSNELATKHFQPVERALAELFTSSQSFHQKDFTERVTLFRVTSTAFVNKAAEVTNYAQQLSIKWQKMLQQERKQRERLDEMLQQLARQHSNLEIAAKAHIPHQDHDPIVASARLSSDEDDNEFFDATSNVDSQFSFDMKTFTSRDSRKTFAHPAGKSHDECASQASGSSSEVEDDSPPRGPLRVVQNDPGPSASVQASSSARPLKADLCASDLQGGVTSSGTAIARRIRIPDKPDASMSLWGIMKNCIGRDLSKIPMPVNFSEPLSMLQRLTEDFEYAHLLNEAASKTDGAEQLAYVAAFTVSSYSTTALRSGKPFNPLLGETYECDRTDDLGWKAISEQVSHHPPMFAQHTEGKSWRSWQEFTMASKFRGKFLQVIPLGISHLTFNDTDNHYTWRKVTTTVHNIIVGKLWIDQHGDMEITNHSNGDICVLKYIPYSYFSKEPQRRVTGYVRTKDKTLKWVINGHWDQWIEISPVLSTAGPKDRETCQTGEPTRVWTANSPLPGSEKFYNFSRFACQLNEPEPGVAPTDSRLRPDQRFMENGQWDDANKEKIRLEEKQRAARRAREDSTKTGDNVHEYEPVWFTKEQDPLTGGLIHVFNQKYWDCKAKEDWSKCPDIF